jgi:hypothetical protein
MYLIYFFYEYVSNVKPDDGCSLSDYCNEVLYGRIALVFTHCTVLSESRCVLILRYGTGSGLYRGSWTSLPAPL